MVVRIFGFRGVTCTGSEGLSITICADGAGTSGSRTEKRFEEREWVEEHVSEESYVFVFFIEDKDESDTSTERESSGESGTERR